MWKSALKGKLVGSWFENQREFYDHIVVPKLDRRFGSKWKSQRIPMPTYSYRTAFRNRARGQRYRAGPRRRRLMVTGRTKRRKKQYAKVKATQLRLGERVGQSTGKRCESIDNTTNTVNSASNQLHISPNILLLEQGDQINQRSRRVVNLRGVELHSIYRFNDSFDDEIWLGDVNPIYLHIALVHPKTGGSIDPTDFFRAYTSERDKNADNVNALESIFSTINTDQYNVYFHKHIKVTKQLFQDAGGMRGPEILWKKYIPIQRQIRFETNTAGSCVDALHYVWWYTASTTGPGVPDNVTWLNHRYRTIVHFREPAN